MLAALLAEARPVSLEDGRLVLAYPPSASFSKRKVEDPPTASGSARRSSSWPADRSASRFELGDESEATERMTAAASRCSPRRR